MRILVVLIQSEGAEAVVAPTVDAAAGAHAVTVLQLCDGRYTDRVCGKLRQDGWMGGRESDEVGQAVGRDYLQRFDEACAEVTRQLREAGLDVRQVSRGGDLVNTVLQVAEEEGDVQLIIVGQPQRSWLTRWFKGVNARVLSDRAACEVRLIELPID